MVGGDRLALCFLDSPAVPKHRLMKMGYMKSDHMKHGYMAVRLRSISM